MPVPSSDGPSRPDLSQTGQVRFERAKAGPNRLRVGPTDAMQMPNSWPSIHFIAERSRRSSCLEDFTPPLRRMVSSFVLDRIGVKTIFWSHSLFVLESVDVPCRPLLEMIDPTGGFKIFHPYPLTGVEGGDRHKSHLH